jgi:type II secretory pathway predicted ATPase ExeA/LysM repeat protein
MFERYFGFSGEPFGTTPDPSCLYESLTHREALASLKYGFNCNRGFTALIGQPGVGKTTLLFRLLEDIRESARSAFLFDIDPKCEPSELIGYILRDIGVTPAASAAAMHDQFKEALVAESRAGRRFVVVIDEAQNLSEATLEMVRLLTNFETPKAKLLQVVLAGQPQLSEKLSKATLVQLRQRISTICRLEPLSAEETIAYIDHRLRLAGYAGKPLFSEAALKLIGEASHGIPREINNLCFNALSICCAMKRKQVNSAMVSEVLADLQLITPLELAPEDAPVAGADDVSEPEPVRRMVRVPKLWISGAAGVLLLTVLTVVGIANFGRANAHGRAEFKPVEITSAEIKAPKSNTAGISAGATRSPNPLSKSTSIKPLLAPTSTKPVGDAAVPGTPSFEVTVEPNQTLQDIAVQYLGVFDLQRLHQIMALNPKLTNPDSIEAGQKLRLPGQRATSEAANAVPPANERNLP